MVIDQSRLRENWELRFTARQQLKGNWGKSILVCFVYTIIVGVSGGVPLLGPLISLLVGGPLLLGLYGYFLKFVKNEPVTIENLFDGFKNFVPSLVLYLLSALFIILWALLLIIPGIIAALSYSMAFYIMYDHPEIKAMEAIDLSKKMMSGQKGKLFLLYLSFFGWGVLCILTLGIGFLWLIPYVQTTMANFYEDLKNASVSEV